MKKLKLSTGTMGSTLHPVSKPAWGEGVPEGNMYLAFTYFPFHHLALHCLKKETKKKRREFVCFYFP
jgi:hypothetical protein